jgi:hypothetical protein
VFISALNLSPGRKTHFLPFFQCLWKLPISISPPDRIASRRGSEI